MIEHLTECRRCLCDRKYLRYFAFVQSSGCGKTRLLHELGAAEPVTVPSDPVTVLYLCMRRSHSTGYPEASAAAASILLLLDDQDSATHFVQAIVAQVACGSAGSAPVQGSTPEALRSQDAFWTRVFISASSTKCFPAVAAFSAFSASAQSVSTAFICAECKSISFACLRRRMF